MERLYLKLTNKHTNKSELLLLCPFGEDDDFLKVETFNGFDAYRVKVDEGYVLTEYFYLVKDYDITLISKGE